MNFLNQITNLFSKIVNFKLVSNHYLGIVFELSASDAFDLSAIVGCNYLINEDGFSMKGRNELFIHRSIFHGDSYIYSPGLFGRDIDGKVTSGNSPDTIKLKFPEIFKENKKLVIYKIENNKRSNIESEIYNNIILNNEDPNDYILLKISDKLNLEPIYEYLAYRYFKQKGYVFENQVPFFQQSFKYKNKILSGGIPDISAFKIPELDQLRKINFYEKNNGFLINKLPFFKHFPMKNKHLDNDLKIRYELIIGEVKKNASGKNQAVKQLDKYENVEVADDLFTFVPELMAHEKYSTMFIDEDTLKYKKKYYLKKENIEHKKIDQNFLLTTIKLNLLSSVDFQELNELICNYSDIKSSQGFFSYNLLHFAIKKDFNEILELCNR